MFKLAGYEPLQRIGGGGFGDVWLATQTSTSRSVAVKVGHTPIEDEMLQVRFERECKALGRLSGHPNVVDIITAGALADGRPYLVLEYIDGGTLWDRLQTEQIPEEDLLKLGNELAEALKAAHLAGVLHRDVKPENVLLRSSGEAVLSDFGLAQLQDGKSTASDAVVASVAYAAPEILQSEQATTLTDLYGIGVCLHAAASQSVPFTKETDRSIQPIIRRVQQEPATPLTEYGYSDSLSSLVKRLLEKDPDDRPPGAVALLRRLDDLLHPELEEDDPWADLLAEPDQETSTDEDINVDDDIHTDDSSSTSNVNELLAELNIQEEDEEEPIADQQLSEAHVFDSTDKIEPELQSETQGSETQEQEQRLNNQPPQEDSSNWAPKQTFEPQAKAAATRLEEETEQRTKEETSSPTPQKKSFKLLIITILVVALAAIAAALFYVFIQNPDTGSSSEPPGSGTAPLQLPLSLETVGLAPGTAELITPSSGPSAPAFCGETPDVDGLASWNGTQYLSPENGPQVHQLVAQFATAENASSFISNFSDTLNCENWTDTVRSQSFEFSGEITTPDQEFGEQTKQFDVNATSGEDTLQTRTFLIQQEKKILILKLTGSNQQDIDDLASTANQAMASFSIK